MATLGDGLDDLPAPSISNSIANSRFSRSTRERDLILELGPEGASAPQEALNEKAVKVIRYDPPPLWRCFPAPKPTVVPSVAAGKRLRDFPVSECHLCGRLCAHEKRAARAMARSISSLLEKWCSGRAGGRTVRCARSWRV